jgi:D-glycero-D-manno-heptose 1,7-bisphosphate phosphatase
MVKKTPNKLAFFMDRDGVINKGQIVDGLCKPPSDLVSLELHDGVVQAVENLLSSGITPIVVTNQPDVARGVQSREIVEQINSRIKDLTGITHFYVCYDDETSNCDCRKPKIGLIKQSSNDLDIDIKSSFLIGDRWKDISAGQAAGVRESFFIDYSYHEKQPSQPFTLVKSLLEASDLVTRERNA